MCNKVPGKKQDYLNIYTLNSPHYFILYTQFVFLNPLNIISHEVQDMHKAIYTFNRSKLLVAVFCRPSFRSYSADAIPADKVSWQVCVADSKVYLRLHGVEYVSGDGRTLLLYMKLHALRQTCH